MFIEKLKDKVSALYDCLVSKASILLRLGDLQAAKKSLHKAYKLKLATKAKEDVEKKLKTGELKLNKFFFNR